MAECSAHIRNGRKKERNGMRTPAKQALTKRRLMAAAGAALLLATGCAAEPSAPGETMVPSARDHVP